MTPKLTLTLMRALLLLFVVSSALGADGVLQPPVASASAAVVSVVPSSPVEDAATQTRAFSDAYSLLLDHYVHPLDTAAMLGAAWDNLVKEADGKAARPDGAPTFSGDRNADLQTMRDAL